MSHIQIARSTQSRLITAAVGGLAGGAVWLFVEVLAEHFSNQHVFSTLAVLVGSFFTVILALIGPVGVRRAASGAALLALPLAALFGLAGLNFDNAADFWKLGYPIWQTAVILIVATPFIAAFLKDKTAWREYPALFDLAWTITVRFAAAWLFAGLFWLVLFLSGALLDLVGLSLIEQLLDIEPVPFVLHGMVLGLALAVVHEMRDYVSPFLILRLLRLLLPLVLVVVALFILALPFRGLNGLFGSFSVAATLMGMAVGAITLITAALDQSDDEAVSALWMRGGTQVLALLLPVMGGLAVYAVSLRVLQYGWTPERLLATTAAIFILLYAILYAAAVVRREAWMARIRQANIWMAMGLVVVSALWLSPLLNAEAISTESQVARFAAGQASAADLPVWQMAGEWGKPGQRGLHQLQAMEEMPEHAALLSRVAAAQEGESRYAFDRNSRSHRKSQDILELSEIVPVLGGDSDGNQRLAAFAFSDWSTGRISEWLEACQRQLQGRLPGCALVMTEAGESAPVHGKGMGFLLQKNGDVDVASAELNAGRLTVTLPVKNAVSGQALQLTGEDLLGIFAGKFRVAPSSRKSLWLGDMELFPNN